MSASKNAYAASRAKSSGTLTTEKSSVIFWILVVFTGLFMFWAPFQRALFNGGPMILSGRFTRHRCGHPLFCCSSPFQHFCFKLNEKKDVLTVLVFMMPLTYVISLSNAASHYLATNMVYIQMLYATFFILGVFLTKQAWDVDSCEFIPNIRICDRPVRTFLLVGNKAFCRTSLWLVLCNRWNNQSIPRCGHDGFKRPAVNFGFPICQYVRCFPNYTNVELALLHY